MTGTIRVVAEDDLDAKTQVDALTDLDLVGDGAVQETRVVATNNTA